MGLAWAVVSMVVVASSLLQVYWSNCCSGAPLKHVPSLFLSLDESEQIFLVRSKRVQATAILCAKG